jgi:WD40 repeat protein
MRRVSLSRFAFPLAFLALASTPVFAQGAWNGTDSLGTGRSAHTITQLPNGKVLVAGGLTGAGATAACELFDPSTGKWTATGAMSTARYGHTATLLPDGRVLVAGGTDGSITLSSCAVYDFTRGTWAATGSLSTARVGHTATLLRTGRVLAAGGNGPLSTCELFDPGTGTWGSTGSMPEGHAAHTATLLGDGRVLVTGGSPAIANAALYDPAAGTWGSTGSLAGARRGHAAVLLPGGLVLALGGTDGAALATCELYNPVAGTWSGTDPLAAGRFAMTATLLPNGRVLVSGGDGGAGPLATGVLYNPAAAAGSRWSAAAALSAARSGHASLVLPSGMVLGTGGEGGAGALSTCEVYDARASSWVNTTTPMTSARADFPAVLLRNGTVLVAGGGTGGAAIADCELYDPIAGIWNTTTSLPEVRTSHTATLLSDGRVIVAGGTPGVVAYSSCRIFDPGPKTWTSINPMASARWHQTATLLPNGKLIVAGGIDNSGYTIASCEIYDPASGLWTSSGSMAYSRAGHTAILLPTGKILVAGGASGKVSGSGVSYTFPTECELYDPGSGAWSPAPSMSQGRQYHTCTLLPSGRILVAGGEYGSATNLCEIYDPVAGTWSTAPALTGFRSMHSAILMPGGRVLVAGGWSGGSLNTCEVFDTTQGTWVPAPAMASVRDSVRTVLLPGGKVLIAGGRTSTGGAIASCELYDDTGAQLSWKPAISTTNGSSTYPVEVVPGSTLAVAGSAFRGISEGGGADFPLVRLVSFPGKDSIKSGDGSNRHWTLPASGWGAGTDLTVSLPPVGETPRGFYMLYVIANGILSEGKVLQIGDLEVPVAPAASAPDGWRAPARVEFAALLQQAILYQWDFDYNGTFASDYASPSSGATFRIYDRQGSYVARLKVTFRDSTEIYYDIPLTILPPATPPTVTVSPATTAGACPLAVTFTPAVTTSTGRLHSLEWDFEGRGVVDLVSTTASPASYTYPLPGRSFTCRVRVTDDLGLSSTGTAVVTTAAGGAPSITSLTALPASTEPGQPVTYTCVATGTIARYEWDFDGDGDIDASENTSATTATATQTFDDVGTYPCRVRVIDGSGVAAEARVTVVVAPPTSLRVWWSQPKDGAVVSGAAVTLHANTAPGNTTARVEFFYRSSTGGPHPDPDDSSWIKIGEALPPPYTFFSVKWNTTGLAVGSYDLLAVATGTGGEKVDNRTRQPVTVTVGTGGSSEEEGTSTLPARSDRTRTNGVSGEIQLTLREGSVAPGTEVTIEHLTGDPRPDQTQAQGLKLGLRSYSRITLSSGGLAKSAGIAMYYRDDNGDDIEDDTKIPVDRLKGFRYDPVDKQWKQLLDVTVDRAEKRVYMRTPAFSDFALGGEAPLTGDGEEGGHKNLCGLMGAEVMVILGLAWLARRRMR